MKILVLNAGSSSEKICLYELSAPLPEDPPAPLWEARIDWGGPGASEVTVRNARGAAVKEQRPTESRAAAIRHLLHHLWDGPAAVISKPSEIAAAGHRVVHGGLKFRQPALVTAEVVTAIERLSELAPLHGLAEVEGIRAIEQILGPVSQVAVFDTAFHSRLPPAVVTYPGPYRWLEEGIRRYGFHGISHEYCAHRAARILGKDLKSLRLITCHLGNGCSLAAIRDGYSVDTTMGFTPLEGLMMGSRSGSIDPGILIHLLRQRRPSADRLDQMLNQESGLRGISGVSSDMRKVLAAMEEGNPRARLAFEIYAHRLRSLMGAMLASLGGLDAVVFTAGVGENCPAVRAAACEAFGFLGLQLDPEKNAQSLPDSEISSSDSAVPVLVIRAREDWAIARECWKLASAG